MEAAHRFVFDKIMTGPDTIRRLDERIVEHLVSVAFKPGGGGHGVPVSDLFECNFKLIVYLIK